MSAVKMSANVKVDKWHFTKINCVGEAKDGDHMSTKWRLAIIGGWKKKEDSVHKPDALRLPNRARLPVPTLFSFLWNCRLRLRSVGWCTNGSYPQPKNNSRILHFHIVRAFPWYYFLCGRRFLHPGLGILQTWIYKEMEFPIFNSIFWNPVLPKHFISYSVFFLYPYLVVATAGL